MKKNLLILMTLFAVAIGYSQPSFTENYLTYQVLTTDPTAVGISGYDMAGGANVVIPATVTDSNNGTTYNVKVIAMAFFGKSITSVVIPNGIATISLNAFRNTQLSSVTIPASVTSIAGNAFANNNQLTCFSVLASIPPTISDGAGGTSDTFGSIRSNIDLVVPQNKLSDYANAGWTGFNSVSEVLELNDTFVVDNITYQVASSSSYIVKTLDYNMAGGSIVNIPSTVTSNCTVYDVIEIGGSSFSQKQLTSVTIPNSVTTIGGNAFSDNNLSNVVIPNNVTEMFNAAFQNNNLTSVTISENITVITGFVFMDNQLQNVDIPDGITQIGTNAFYNNQLTSLDIPNSVTSIGTGAFNNNSTLTSVNLSNSLNSIGQAAFFNCALINVDFPNSLTTIGIQAFANNYTITTLSMPNSVNSIGDYAFQNNQLTSITIPASVTSIGAGAFRSNPLTSVTSLATTPATINTVSGVQDTFVSGGDRSGIALYIPSNTTDIYVTTPNAGADWSGFNPVTELLAVGDPLIADYISYEVTSSSLNTIEAIDYDVSGGGTALNIPTTVNYNSTDYTVTSIKFNAFDSKNLTSVTIPNTVAEIGANALAFNQLSSVVIPDNITVIRGGTFQDNNLSSIIIPENVVLIQAQAFKSNPLTDVISLPSTPPNMPGVSGSVSDAFDNRNGVNLVIPNGTTDEYVTDSGAFWTDFKIILEITSVTNNTLKVFDYNTASGTNVNIPATITDGSEVYNVTEIGNGAFFSKGLTSVTIPNSVTTIETSAFNTNNLTSVTIPDSVVLIGSQAFLTNDLTNITIGNSVTNIDFAAFADNDLTSITIPSNVTTIGSVAFAANPLTSVTSFATTPPTITTGTNDTFEISGDRSNIHLHIPPGTMGAYVTDSGALWTGFNPVTQDAILSTSDFEIENGIKIITNNDELKILSSGSAKLKSYSIYNISGSKMKNGSEYSITIDNLSNGIYILELTFDTGKLVKKFAK